MTPAALSTSTRSHDDPTPAQAVCVDPLEVRRLWPHVAPLIKRAMTRGGLSDFAGVAADVLEGAALLWLAWDGTEILGAAVTQLGIGADGRKLCTIVACASAPSRASSRDTCAFARWGFLIAALERHAREEGCAAMRINGRRGWARVLKDYRTKAIILEKELA